MKKTLSILMVLVLVLSVFTGCSKKADAPAATAAPEVKAEKPAPAPKKAALKVGMVTDSGTIDDRSFNQGTYEGVKAAADELGLECTYL